MKEHALLWKEIGGNLSALKVRGRWYFLGTTDRELRQASAAFQLTRVQGVPAAIERLFRLHGRTTAALKRLPVLRIGMTVTTICTCKDPECLGPDPQHPAVLHRTPGARIVGYDRDGYVEVRTPRGRVHWLLPGRQVPHPIVVGTTGSLQYIKEGPSASLHHFVPNKEDAT